MRIFIAGGTGAIGSRLVPRLVEAGHAVVAATRTQGGADRLAAAGATPRVVDVYDRGALVAAVGEARPEVVVHQLTDLAGGDTNANAALRVKGTRHLVDAAKAAGVRRMVAQSIAWAYAPGAGPAVESDPLELTATGARGTSVQGVAALEAAVAELREFVVLRYGLLYGPGTWYAKGGLMADKARRRELPANDAVSSFVHVDDAATACVLALSATSGSFNVCDHEPAPASSWLPVFAARVGAPEPPREGGGPDWARGADNRRARRELGLALQFPSWRDGFERGA
jgi:nucleoside-diphosphate-sugar epimerase